MLTTEILNKPLMMMTGSEIMELFGNIIPRMPEPHIEQDFTDGYVCGIRGLAKALGCGVTKAQQIRNSGKIDEATFQHGKKILFHKQKVRELLNEV